MNDSRSEYIGNGNGHANGNGNGNGHGEKFGIVAKEDPLLSRVVPAARRKVCHDTTIPEAARMFFCWLTDMSLLFGVYIRKGVVKFSDSYLAERFKVSDRTIRNWKRHIQSTNEVWTTEKFMKNSFPQTVYNISCIVGQETLPLSVESEDGSLPEDEVFRSNRRRLRTANRVDGKFACRVHNVPGCELCRRKTPPRIHVPATETATQQNAEEKQPSGKILPPPTEINFRPPRKTVSADNGNGLPSRTETDCRPARKTVAAVGGNRFPQRTEKGFRNGRQTDADNGETQVGDKSLSENRGEAPAPRDDQEVAFKAWEKRLDDMRNSDLRKAEEIAVREFQAAKTDKSWENAKRKLVAIRLRLRGPVVADEPAKPVPQEKPKREPMPLHEARARFAKAKAEARL